MRYLLMMFMALLSQHIQAMNVTQQVIPGVVYQKITQVAPNLSINILFVDPFLANIQLVHATSSGTNTELVPSIGSRSNISLGIPAAAAINGIYFRRCGRYNGNPLRIEKIGNTFYTDPLFTSGAVGWDPNGTTLFNRIQSIWSLKIGGVSYPIDRVNQPRGQGETVLYTSSFAETTLTDINGTEVVISGGVVTAVNTSDNSAIPAGGYVYSVASNAPVFVFNIQPGLPVTLTNTITVFNNPALVFTGFFLLGAMPLLYNNSGIQPTVANWTADLTSGVPIVNTADEVSLNFNTSAQISALINTPQARTAVGITAAGKWVFVVVDGGSMASVGMTLSQLATFMQSMGCVSAVNLGGAGDSTMEIANNVVNVPSGDPTCSPGSVGIARPVADSICIYARNIAPGTSFT